MTLCRAEHLDVVPDAPLTKRCLSQAFKLLRRQLRLELCRITNPIGYLRRLLADRNTRHSSAYSGVSGKLCAMHRDGTGALASGYATMVVDQSGDWQWDFSHQKGTTTSDGSSAGPTLVQLLFGHRFPDPDIKSTLTI